MRIFWGIIMIAIGFGIIRYRRNVHDFTGNISLFEKYLGNTQDGFTLVAILVMIFAIMYMTGSIDSILKGSVSQYFGGSTPEAPAT